MSSGTVTEPLSADYLDRFGGVGRLFGRDALERLNAAHVAVIGVGGVGSWAVEALARSGVGALTLVDLDDVCVTNVNRQLPALDGQIGRPKVTALTERVRLINPACRIAAVHEFFTAASAPRVLSPEFDYVIDTVDRMSIKALLIAGCRERGRRVVTIGAAGGRQDPTRIRSGDIGEASDELLRQVRKKLRRVHGFDAGAHIGISRLGVPAVWSDEQPVYPWANGTGATAPEPGSSLKLDCESGFGTAVFVNLRFNGTDPRWRGGSRSQA
ncbi:MAG: tRNA threonylcarbamoyladenosine dehydratase [Opitutaceae bacterium]|nr:tRNA threonylcarbamoyladenosine dehydratase [Opitutaceae bacterium]